MNQVHKIAIVVQRCGTNISAGAEVYALKLAEALANQNHKVEVLSSQSDDYILWNNNLPEHETIKVNKNQLHIKRFPVTHSRLKIIFAFIKRFNFIMNKYLNPVYNTMSPLLDYIFLKSQGPWCPKLWEYLKNNSSNYSIIIVKSYLYSSNYYAIQNSFQNTKTLLIVTSHDEPEFRLNFVTKIINNSKYLAFVSNAEKDLCYQLKPISRNKPYFLLPPGFSEDSSENGIISEKIQNILNQKYFLYLGRIEKKKNIDFIFKNTPQNTLVVFAGDLKIDFPEEKRFMYLGRITELEKKFLLQKTLALLMVSKLEAYSMVTAEAIKQHCLVLALKGCQPVEELISTYGGYLCDENQYQKTMMHIWDGTFQFDKNKLKSELIAKEKSFQENANKILSLL